MRRISISILSQAILTDRAISELVKLLEHELEKELTDFTVYTNNMITENLIIELSKLEYRYGIKIYYNLVRMKIKNVSFVKNEIAGKVIKEINKETSLQYFNQDLEKSGNKDKLKMISNMKYIIDHSSIIYHTRYNDISVIKLALEYASRKKRKVYLIGG